MNPFDSFHVGVISLFMSQGKYIYAGARLSVRTLSARPSVVHSTFTFFVTRYVFSILFSNLFPNFMCQGCGFFNCWSSIIGSLSYTGDRVSNIFEWNTMRLLVFSIFWSEISYGFLYYQYFGVKCYAVSGIFDILELNAMWILVFLIFWSEITCGFSWFHFTECKILLSIVV